MTNPLANASSNQDPRGSYGITTFSESNSRHTYKNGRDIFRSFNDSNGTWSPEGSQWISVGNENGNRPRGGSGYDRAAKLQTSTYYYDYSSPSMSRTFETVEGGT